MQAAEAEAEVEAEEEKPQAEDSEKAESVEKAELVEPSTVNGDTAMEEVPPSPPHHTHTNTHNLPTQK